LDAYNWVLFSSGLKLLLVALQLRLGLRLDFVFRWIGQSLCTSIWLLSVITKR